MGIIDFHSTDVNNVYYFECFHKGDNRGSFSKTFEKNVFATAGIRFEITETFSSKSAKNVIRGLHFQTHYPQAKIVTVLSGAIWDVVVDLRPDSPTFKKWISFELNERNNRGLYIPRGFAHGFVSLEDNTVMLYQCDGKYDAETDTGIRFDDPDIGIDWPVNESLAIHSNRDLKLPSFKDYIKRPMDL